MKVYGDVESVNLSTGERYRRVSGDGESSLEKVMSHPLTQQYPISEEELIRMENNRINLCRDIVEKFSEVSVKEEIITQSAPYPSALKKLVDNVKYKEGWDFTLVDLDRGQGSKGLTLIIRITVPDSYHPEHMFTVLHYMIVPAASYNEQSWKRWLFDQILLVERHEACEFFMIDDFRPYAPHHGPGFDPYQIFEHGEQEDAQTTFRGEKFELPAKE